MPLRFLFELPGLSQKIRKQKNGLTCSSFVIVYRMNDPHVETLFYRIDHSEGVDYSKAPPLELPEPKFTIRIKNEWARIDIRDHYSAEQDARDIVEPFLCAWEPPRSIVIRAIGSLFMTTRR
jgi:hypothetical protein